MLKQKTILIILLSISVSSAFGQINVEVQNDVNFTSKQLVDLQKVVEKSLESDFIIIIISLIIAISAVIGTIITAIYLRKQVNYSEQESELRSDSWLTITGLGPTQVVLKTGGIISYERWQNTPKSERPEIKSVIMEFNIKNVGYGIAKNIFRILIIQDERFDRTVFEQDKEINTYVNLAPQQEFHTMFSVLWDRWITTDQNNLFAGLSLSYDGLKRKKYVGTIFGIKKGSNFFVDSWISD